MHAVDDSPPPVSAEPKLTNAQRLKRQRDDRLAKGLCTQCGGEIEAADKRRDARIRRCWACRVRLGDLKRKWRKTRKGRKSTNRTRKRWYAKNPHVLIEQQLETYRFRVEHNLCTICGKQDPRPNRRSCADCAQKISTYEHDRHVPLHHLRRPGTDRVFCGIPGRGEVAADLDHATCTRCRWAALWAWWTPWLEAWTKLARAYRRDVKRGIERAVHGRIPDACKRAA